MGLPGATNREDSTGTLDSASVSQPSETARAKPSRTAGLGECDIALGVAGDERSEEGKRNTSPTPESP